jgi:hypothetical protein
MFDNLGITYINQILYLNIPLLVTTKSNKDLDPHWLAPRIHQGTKGGIGFGSSSLVLDIMSSNLTFHIICALLHFPGSGSIGKRNGSADPDPYQNVTDPQHWAEHHTMETT